jgi:hypothetical protein
LVNNHVESRSVIECDYETTHSYELQIKHF